MTDARCVRRASFQAPRLGARYIYRDAPGFDMPMASTLSAYLAAPAVMAVGQAQAQYAAHRNEAIQLDQDRDSEFQVPDGNR